MWRMNSRFWCGPFFGNWSVLLRHDLIRLGPPLCVLERSPDVFPLGDNLPARFGRPVVINDVAVCGEQRGEDVLVLLENCVHEAVSFVHEEAGRAGRAAVGVLVNAEAALRVFENAGRQRVAEKLAEEAIDARMADDRADNLATQVGVNLGGEIGLVVEQTQHFAFVVLARVQSPVLGGSPQCFIRPTVAQSVGNRPGTLARRQHLPALRVRRARAKFQAVEKLRFEQHGQQHLPQTFRIAANRDGVVREPRILRQLRLARRAPQHAGELRTHRLVDFLIGRR
jgi:hypothetical protein